MRKTNKNKTTSLGGKIMPLKFKGLPTRKDLEWTARNVVSFREHLGMSQTEFGKRIGVARQTIADWESGERVPSELAQKALQNYFNILEKHGREMNKQEAMEKE